MVEGDQRCAWPGTLHLLQRERRRKRNAQLSLRQCQVVAADLKKPAANGIALPQHVDCLGYVVLGKCLCHEADGGTAQRKRLLQMRQEVANEQVLLGGDREANGQNLNGV